MSGDAGQAKEDIGGVGHSCASPTPPVDVSGDHSRMLVPGFEDDFNAVVGFFFVHWRRTLGRSLCMRRSCFAQSTVEPTPWPRASGPTASMQTSGPRPPVRISSSSTTFASTCSKLMHSAPRTSRAMSSRSCSRSIATVRTRPSCSASKGGCWKPKEGLAIGS